MSVINRIKRLVNKKPVAIQAQLPLLQQSAPLLAPNRDVMRYYITGNGIEIGALHLPLDLTGLPVTSIKYVDRLSGDKLRRHYRDLGDAKFVPVDIVDDGEVLGKINNESLDFIIGNHLIEHARNPMGTISNWLSKLKPGGIIFMAVPDKRYTFDIKRELTSLQHLVGDYHSTPEERPVRDRPHYVEWALIDLSPDKAEAWANKLIEMNYSIHFHTFTLQSFLAMINYLCQECNAPLAIKACSDVIKGSNEFLVVLTRT